MENQIANPTMPRSQALWCGAKRGARLGALTSLVIGLLLSTMGLTIMLTQPSERDKAFGSFIGIVSAIGGCFGGIGLMVFYGAIAGALIMGIAALFRAQAEGAQTEC